MLEGHGGAVTHPQKGRWDLEDKLAGETKRV